MSSAQVVHHLCSCPSSRSLHWHMILCTGSNTVNCSSSRKRHSYSALKTFCHITHYYNALSLYCIWLNCTAWGGWPCNALSGWVGLTDWEFCSWGTKNINWRVSRIAFGRPFSPTHSTHLTPALSWCFAIDGWNALIHGCTPDNIRGGTRCICSSETEWQEMAAIDLSTKPNFLYSSQQPHWLYMSALEVRVLLKLPVMFVFWVKNKREAKAVSPPTHRPFVQTDSSYHLDWVSDLFYPFLLPLSYVWNLCLLLPPNRPWYKLCKRVDRLSSLFFPRLIVALDRGCPFKLSEWPFHRQLAKEGLFQLILFWCIVCLDDVSTPRLYKAIQLSAAEKILSKTCQPMSEKCRPVWPIKFSKGVKVSFTNPQAIVPGFIYQPLQKVALKKVQKEKEKYCESAKLSWHPSFESWSG